MTPAQNVEISKQVSELLGKGLIHKILSSYVVLPILAPKKYGKWRLSTDSKAVNKITIKYQFLIPRIDDLLDQFDGASYFSKNNLKSGYH